MTFISTDSQSSRRSQTEKAKNHIQNSKLSPQNRGPVPDTFDSRTDRSTRFSPAIRATVQAHGQSRAEGNTPTPGQRPTPRARPLAQDSPGPMPARFEMPRESPPQISFAAYYNTKQVPPSCGLGTPAHTRLRSGRQSAKHPGNRPFSPCRAKESFPGRLQSEAQRGRRTGSLRQASRRTSGCRRRPHRT